MAKIGKNWQKLAKISKNTYQMTNIFIEKSCNTELLSKIYNCSFKENMVYRHWSSEYIGTLLSNEAYQAFLLYDYNNPDINKNTAKSMMIIADLGNEIEIIQLATLPSQRRKGYASYLLRYLHDEYLHLRLNYKILLEVAADNSSAINIYIIIMAM